MHNAVIVVVNSVFVGLTLGFSNYKKCPSLYPFARNEDTFELKGPTWPKINFLLVHAKTCPCHWFSRKKRISFAEYWRKSTKILRLTLGHGIVYAFNGYKQFISKSGRFF
jgi:hypothetical protein